MPSDTAFLGDMPAGDSLAGAYDSLGRTTDTLGRGRPFAAGKLGFSPRELSGMIINLRALGIDIDENSAVLKGLRTAILTNYSLYLLYGAWTAMRRAQTAKETAYATAETIALAVAQQWHLIAQGTASAALVYSAFKVGENIGSGDWTLSGFDMSNPLNRREASRRLEQIRG